jgi:protein deglycase
MNHMKILVAIANGCEELEAITIVDVLRRARLPVLLASIDELEIMGAHNIKIVADSLFSQENLSDYGAIILPGGNEGARRMAAYGPLNAALKQFDGEQKIIAAICASPAVVLSPLGLLDNKKATGYTSLKAQIPNYLDQSVVVSKNIITSQGPGTALEFALKLVHILASPQLASSIRQDMLVRE